MEQVTRAGRPDLNVGRQAEPAQGTGAEVLDQQVGIVDEIEQLAPPAEGAQVEFHRGLAPVPRREPCGSAAQRVTTRPFDLDHPAPRSAKSVAANGAATY